MYNPIYKIRRKENLNDFTFMNHFFCVNKNNSNL